MVKINKLKLMEVTKKDYLIELPRRFKDNSKIKSLIRLKCFNGLYSYIPRKHTFLRFRFLTAEELRAIADKLDKLNKIGEEK